MNLEKYIQFWENYIKSLDGKIDLSYRPGNELNPIFELSKKMEASLRLNTEHMPEPYLGNLLSSEITWLFLSLNPGPVCDEQLISKGKWFTQVKENSYFKFAEENKYHKDSKNMWSESHRLGNVKKWARETNQNEPGICNIANIELIPFHSKDFRVNKLTPNIIRDVFELYWRIITEVIRRQKQKIHLIVLTPKWLSMLLRYYADRVEFPEDNGTRNLWDLIRWRETSNEYARDVIEISDNLEIHIWPRIMQKNIPVNYGDVDVKRLIDPRFHDYYDRFRSEIIRDWRMRLNL